jgi:hypothetical protein
MFEFTESVLVNAPPHVLWDVLRDVDSWWEHSNPEHDSLEHLDDLAATEVGAKLRIREEIGGIPGEAIGVVTAVEPDTAVTWEAKATYRWLRMIAVPIREGVTWKVQSHGDTATVLSARVWAAFPRTLIGRLMEFLFTRLLNGVAKDRRHARTELDHLKRIVEGTVA